MNFCPNCGHSHQGMAVHTATTQSSVKVRSKAKVKRAPSAYNKRYAMHYKRLKKAHPRSSFAALGKKAHKAARRKK